MSSFEPVPLDPAFAWTCPKCEHRNFVESARIKFDSEEDLREALIQAGTIEAWQEIPEDAADGFYVAPDSATCAGCAAQFAVVDVTCDEDD